MAVRDPRSTASRGVTRRGFLRRAGILTGTLLTSGIHSDGVASERPVRQATDRAATDPLRLFLSGDVMSGRAIDQVLPHSVPPRLYEPFITDARDYVRLAEAVNGAIRRPVDDRYVWGDALQILRDAAPDALAGSPTSSSAGGRRRDRRARLRSTVPSQGRRLRSVAGR